MLGVFDLGDESVESVEEVAGRIRAGLAALPAERLVLAPEGCRVRKGQGYVGGRVVRSTRTLIVKVHSPQSASQSGHTAPVLIQASTSAPASL